MSRIYAIPFTATITTGGARDLWEVTPADDKPVKLCGIRLGNLTEVGDAAEECLRITVKRLGATFTTGNGTAGAPESPDSADTAPGFASETNSTTVATTSGATDILDEIAWNERNTPFETWYPDERYRPKVKGGEGLVVRLESAPALGDSMDFAGTIWVEEE